MERAVLALDIGGTKLAAGVVRDDGAVLASGTVPTGGATGDELFERLVDLVERVRGEGGLGPTGPGEIGVGCGGPMRFPDGVVSPLNIPLWRDFPLKARLEARFDARVVVDNDAKAFALGEHWLGAGRGARGLLAMVVSTGVGGGVVFDGRLLDGAHGNAGHVGHVVVFPGGPRCACGGRGCLEAVASGTGLARQAAAARARGEATSLPVRPTGADLAAAARGGDRLALRLFRRAGVALGRGIASAAAVLDLDRVVLGGGVTASAGYFLPALRRELDARAGLDFTRGLPVVLSSGTIDAALAGAARLVLVD